MSTSPKSVAADPDGVCAVCRPGLPASEVPAEPVLCAGCGPLLLWVQRHFAAQLGIRRSRVTAEQRLREDLQMDSLDAVEILTALEDDFRIRAGEADIALLQTVADVVRWIGAQRRGRGADSRPARAVAADQD